MPREIAGKTVYTLPEIAALLKVSQRSVYTYIKAGRLRAQKYGRRWHVTEDSLQAFLDGVTHGPAN